MSKKHPNMEKFEGNKPLVKFTSEYYPDKYNIKYRKFEPPKEFDLYTAIRGNRLPENNNIVFGIKAKPEEFYKFDFLTCWDSSAFIVHNRVVNKFNELCPDDFQALPIILKNLDSKDEPFENKDFCLINILKLVDGFDKEYIEYSDLGVPEFKKKVLLDNCMNGALLARDKIFKSRILFHPSLAKHFIKSKGIQFLSDVEMPIG